MFRLHPLFERPSNLPSLDLLPLDEEILRKVRLHRFLRAEQIIRATGERDGRILHRLEQLFAHGYLSRPASQWRHGDLLKTRNLIYGLAKRGVRHLKELGEVTSHRIHEKVVGDLHLVHTVEVAEFMIRLETELPLHVKLEYLDDGSQRQSVATCSWSVPVFYRGDVLQIGVVPDRVFRLSTAHEELVFCLEVDRGTMPVMRSNPAQSSFYRKLLAYHETWRSGLHTRELGWNRFRMLTLTSSAARRDHLIEVCRELVAAGGSGLFLFADKPTFANAESLLRMPWLTGDGYNTAKLLAETR
ncbi:MAG: replication-relaxation family protein, partial [Verrucomicrobiae bacterium]|nr:replication-relaxation family protein [Verrucomicrobiae bacterium]